MNSGRGQQLYSLGQPSQPPLVYFSTEEQKNWPFPVSGFLGGHLSLHWYPLVASPQSNFGPGGPQQYGSFGFG